MDSLLKAHRARHTLLSIIRRDVAFSRSIPASHPYHTSSIRPNLRSQQRRHASSSSNTAKPSKPITLEQPDKFRPPSHPQRLVKGRRSNTFGGAYNQGSTVKEKEAQRTKRYPHTFPNEGTRMHWFLMNRKLHLGITLTVLLVCAAASLVETFLKTSPYAHLIPPISSLPLHPIDYVRDCLNVYRLQLSYTTAQTDEFRADKMLDVAKRRLYRRAHGMEDLYQQEQGIDIRGLVEWDDGYTELERERGRPLGRRPMSNKEIMEMGGRPGDGIDWGARREREEMRVIAEGNAKRRMEAEEIAAREAEERRRREEEQRPKRSRKLWLGIW